MPNQRTGDVDERHLRIWIANNKVSKGGTSSEREQLMRREILLACKNNWPQDNKWNNNLTKVKMFINTEGRIPNRRAGDVDERRLGIWLERYKGIEGGTNSKRGQLMRSEIPLAFAKSITMKSSDPNR
jgi:hypothetical protein